MVPDRMYKTDERYTGRWWFEAAPPRFWGAPRIRIIMEIDEGWLRHLEWTETEAVARDRAGGEFRKRLAVASAGQSSPPLLKEGKNGASAQ